MYEVDRFIACCVMVFGKILPVEVFKIVDLLASFAYIPGSLFLSMPLAIIGNEYDKAWNEVIQDKEISREAQLRETIEFAEKAKAAQEKSGAKAQGKDAPAHYVALAISASVLEERRRQAALNEKEINAMPVIASLLHTQSLVKQALVEGVRSSRMTPRVLLLFCEVRASIPTLYFLIKQAHDCSLGNGDTELPYYFPGASASALQQIAVGPTAGGGDRRMSLFNRTTFSAAVAASHTNNAIHRPHNNAVDVRPSSTVGAAVEEQKQNSTSGSGATTLSRKVRQSLIQLPSHVRTAATKLITKGTVSEDFKRRYEEAEKNPNHFRNRLWVLLEVPQSSKEARILQLLLVFLVILSIFVLYTQTVISLSSYGDAESHYLQSCS